MKTSTDSISEQVGECLGRHMGPVFHSGSAITEKAEENREECLPNSSHGFMNKITLFVIS